VNAVLDWLAMLGRAGFDALARLGRGHVLLVGILAGLGPLLRRPRLLLQQLYSVGVLSVLIIGVSGIFVGMVLGLQGHYILSRFGAEATLATSLATLFLAATLERVLQILQGGTIKLALGEYPGDAIGELA
jgi:phospholipid/cholesterol/gamma-HCH transport system permease protein